MEKLSLEQLKAMSDSELDSLWASGGFPFDESAICGTCLTQHTYVSCFCDVAEHEHLIEQVKTLLGVDCMVRGEPQILRQHLEEFYALRLFYDHLYPQPEAPAGQLEATEEKVLAACAAEPGLSAGSIALPAELPEKCRCRAAFKTYEELLEHIATGPAETRPHVSEEAAERLEAMVESWRDAESNT